MKISAQLKEIRTTMDPLIIHRPLVVELSI